MTVEQDQGPERKNRRERNREEACRQMSRQAPHSEHTEIRARTAEFLANALLEPLPDGLIGSLLHKPTMMQNMGQSVSRARQPGSQADLAPTHSTAGASSTRGQSCQAGPKGWAEEPQCLTQQSRDMPTGAKVGRNAGSPASSTRQRARRLRQPEPKAAQGAKPFRKPNPKAAESPESAPPTNRRRLQIHAHTRDASPPATRREAMQHAPHIRTTSKPGSKTAAAPSTKISIRDTCGPTYETKK